MTIKQCGNSYIFSFPSGNFGIFTRENNKPLVSLTDFHSTGVTLPVKELRELLEWIDENEEVKPIEKVDGYTL